MTLTFELIPSVAQGQLQCRQIILVLAEVKCPHSSSCCSMSPMNKAIENFNVTFQSSPSHGQLCQQISFDDFQIALEEARATHKPQ